MKYELVLVAISRQLYAQTLHHYSSVNNDHSLRLIRINGTSITFIPANGIAIHETNPIVWILLVKLAFVVVKRVTTTNFGWKFSIYILQQKKNSKMRLKRI